LGFIVIALLVLILATLLGGEEGFVATAPAGLGCTAASCLFVLAIVIFVVGMFFAAMYISG